MIGILAIGVQIASRDFFARVVKYVDW